MDNKNEVLIYEDKDGKTRVNVKFTDEDVQLTQNQLAEIYKTTQQNISQHINAIYNDNELPSSTNKKFLLVQKEGNRNVKRSIDHYNLDMIIALGYRVQSDVAVRFRIWATKRLHEYIQKGFTMDDNRLKQGGNRCFKELDIIFVFLMILYYNSYERRLFYDWIYTQNNSYGYYANGSYCL